MDCHILEGGHHSLKKCGNCPFDGNCRIQKMLEVSEYIERIIKIEGDGVLDRIFRRPNIFRLIQSYEILAGIGEEFDLKNRYYDEMINSVSSDAKEKFEENILLGDRLMMAIRALILQRADQLMKAAIEEVCTRDGVCHACWINEVCKAKAERG